MQGVAGEFGSVVQLVRDGVNRPKASAQWYVSHMAGCLASYAAQIGKRDKLAALTVLQDRILEYWAEHDWDKRYDQHRLGLGDVLPEDQDEEGGDDDAPF